MTSAARSPDEDRTIGRLIPALALALLAALPCGLRAESYDLGGFRLALIDDPFRVQFQGGSAELTGEKVAQAIKSAAEAAGWRVIDPGPDRMELMEVVRGKHMVSVGVSYGAGGYTLRYLQSSNLLYQELNRQGSTLRAIHRNYNEWIRSLVAAINSAAGVPAQIAVGFAPVGDVDAVPFLRQEGREAYRQFLAAPTPRAFAIAPNGSWGQGSRRGFRGRNDVAERAMTRCNRRGNAQCRLYAIDDHVVWTASAARPLSGDDLVRHVARFGGGSHPAQR